MTEEDIAAFRNAARALAGAEKTVMSEVAKSMRAAARPVVNEIRAEVRSSKGESPKGVSSSAVERQLHVLSKIKDRPSGRIHDEATGHLSSELIAQEAQRIRSRQRSVQRRLTKAASLREQIAAASGSSVSASDKKVALAFKVRAGNLPPSQRKLPRRWDKPGGWRHPVFGNRDVWVPQKGHPYFRTTITQNRGQVTTAVVTAMTVAAEKIMNPEGESA
jgi:guanyl-specific ribonuclease Sa